MQRPLQRLALTAQLIITTNRHRVNCALGLLVGVEILDSCDVKSGSRAKSPLNCLLPMILLANCCLYFGDVKMNHGANVA